MIYALKPQFRGFGSAHLVVGVEKVFFKYSIYENKNKGYNTPSQNLIVEQDNKTIQTTWDLPFKPNMQVVLGGELYKITRCRKIKDEVNEQSLGLLKDTYSEYWLIDLTR